MLYGSTHLIAEELISRGFSIEELEPYLYFATNGTISFYGKSAKTPAQSSIVNNICHNKHSTKLFLQHQNFPSAHFVLVTADTVEKAQVLKFPVVIKPLEQFGGIGVVTNVKNIQEIHNYFNSHPYKEILVEETLFGDDCRLLVVQGEFFAACRRIPAYIEGDGKSSISELIEKENIRRQKLLEEQELQGKILTSLHTILFDQEVENTLKSSGKTLDDVPAADERVFVRRNSNVSTGGVSIDVTENVAESLREMVTSIASALGANTLGVDIMTNDLSKPLNPEEGSGIVEINHSPYLLLHSHPSEGVSRNAAPKIVNEVVEFLTKNPQLCSKQYGK